MPKGIFIKLWIWRKKKNHPRWEIAGCRVFSVSLSPGGTETLVCCCSVLPGFGNLSETLWEMYCSQGPLFVSLRYADKPDIKRGSHGDEKEPADTVQRWGGEKWTINVGAERNSNQSWPKRTRMREALGVRGTNPQGSAWEKHQHF